MKRFSILVACAIMMWPASQACASTWSWHSEIMQKIMDTIHQATGQNLTHDRTPTGPQGSPQRTRQPASSQPTR